ncbi:NlpC/P60 family protein [Cochleicola gelatinilyticus]|uniref:NlpC/P60 domain-containing protein n=1 Tax=Cochleicola gelatinilyticus TaxID=1763537 RepID=A0A167HLT4_9FLAO|nr:NlpC/P60 family protein [Cochleicola gelatinilyticus]OAB78748.1 hypothetical protein ULVI_09200 [Cochleicola gelatinilyticus]
MKFLFNILLFIFTPFLAISQNFTGVVLEEETTVEIMNAIVVIEGTALAQKTNEVGEFSFFEDIPVGEQIVTVSKEGYETKYFIITVESGKRIVTDKIELEVTREESKRRRKLKKEREKEAKKLAKEREEMIENVRKEKEDELKRLAKERKKLENKSGDVVISYDPIENTSVQEIPIVPDVDPVQVKYAAILGVEPSSIINIELYKFIEDWTGTPYVMGGANKEGIDCSSFTQRLFTKVYDLYIERTAQKQFNSKYTDEFTGRQFLEEGDLIFFGKNRESVNHVGVYLRNNKFVHATARIGKSGSSGVKISDLTDSNWANRFLAGGKRINNE